MLSSWLRWKVSSVRDLGVVGSECEVKFVVMCLNKSVDEEEETNTVVLYKVESLNLQLIFHSSRYASTPKYRGTAFL